MSKEGKKEKKDKEKKVAAEGKEAKPKKPSKAGKSKVREIPDGVVEMKHSKAKPFIGRDRNPYTGTRFRANTSQQTAYDIIRKGAKEGKTVDEMKTELTAYRTEHGKDRDLDAGYLPFVIATHSEDFEVVKKGDKMTIKLLKDVKPDEKAIVELKAREAKKKAAMEKRKTGKKTDKKAEKVSKKEGKVPKVVKEIEESNEDEESDEESES